MRVIDRIIYIIFSVIIFVTSLILSFIIFGWITIPTVTMIIEKILNNSLAIKITLSALVLLILFAIKGIFFSSSKKDINGFKEGILLENEDGKLLISKETIENLVKNVANGFHSTENIATKIAIDKENNLIIFVNLQVYSNTVIKDLSSNMQARIKEEIKSSTDLAVKEVNIRIKNITPQKEIINEQEEG